MSEKTEMIRREEAMAEKNSEMSAVSPFVDIYENDDEILLRADMPGVDKKNIIVDVDNGKLNLEGTRNIETKGSAQWEEFGGVAFLRTFAIPQTIDVEKIKAELVDGVLSLHLPKSAAAKPRQIEIKTA